MSYDAVLKERFGTDGFSTSEFRDNRRVIAAPQRLAAIPVLARRHCGQ